MFGMTLDEALWCLFILFGGPLLLRLLLSNGDDTPGENR